MPYRPVTEVRVEPERVNPPLKLQTAYRRLQCKFCRTVGKEATIGSAKASNAAFLNKENLRFILPP